MITVSHAPSNLVACRNAHIQYLCERMRPDEIEQYLALTGMREFNADVVARGFQNTPGFKFTLLGKDGLPAACGGYEEVIPGVWQSWMVGTCAGWGAQWRSLTKSCRWLMGNLLKSGARRLETLVLAKRTHTIEWYERALGLECEGTKRKFGAHGEDAMLFARVA